MGCALARAAQKDDSMKTNRTSSRGATRSLLPALTIVGLVGVALTGCRGENPGPGSPAYKQGELGNGAFLFTCDDSVACDRWSTNDAKDFPPQIATGSAFELRFVASGEQGVTFTTKEKYPGVTSQPIGPYVSSGPDGFTALKPGYGTVVARDNTGVVIDYVTLKIVKPDALVVYAAEYKGTNPPAVQALNLKLGARRSFRTVAEHKSFAVAGSVQIRWESLDAAIVQVESYERGVVNVVAKKEGKTKLTAAGAALTKDLDVEVTL
jgi:hypothetical protein